MKFLDNADYRHDFSRFFVGETTGNLRTERISNTALKFRVLLQVVNFFSVLPVLFLALRKFR